MVKSEGRAKGSKGKGSAGGTAPSSPTRRLKKGGKRGRRLCHMDGCTLCPSFGFEGDVAVSCSHHKEEGMRNLTARRCQHEGCFTVANFGMPGDKPGFCAAHSTEGMVNRNKPRGAEGMLAGVTIARSSRRASKANTAMIEAAAAAAAEAEAAATAAAEAAKAAAVADRPAQTSTAVRNRPASGGKDLLLRAAAAREGPAFDGVGVDGGDYGAARKVGTRGRVSGRRRVSHKEGPNVERRVESDGADSPDRRSKHQAWAKTKSTKADERGAAAAAAAAPASLVTFIARGEDLETISAGGGGSSRADATKGGACRVRSRVGSSKGLGAAAVTAGMLHRPAAVVQDVFYSAPRGGDGEDLRMLLSGRAGGRGDRAGLDLGYAGELKGGAMMDSSLFMGPSCLESDGIEVPLGLDMGGGLEDILGAAQPHALERKGRAPSTFVDGNAGRSKLPGLRASQLDTLRPGGSLGSAGPAVIGAGAGLVTDDGDVDFELDHLPELNSVDLGGLRAIDAAGAGMSREARQAPPRAADVDGSRCMNGRPMSLRLNGGGSPVPRASSSGHGSAPLCSAESSSTPVVASSSAATVAEVRSATASISPAEPLVPTKLPSDEAWWDVLDGEDFVPMPEPVWGVTLDVPSIDEEPLGVDGGDHREWRGGNEGGDRGTASAAPASLGGDELTGDNGSGKSAPCGVAAQAAKSRSVSPSCLALGGVLCPMNVAAAAEGGYTGEGGNGGRSDAAGGVVPLSGIGSRANGSVDRNGDGLSPAKKRNRLCAGDSDPFPSALTSGASSRPNKRDVLFAGVFPSAPCSSSGVFSSAPSTSNGIFSSAPSTSNGAFPGAPVGFGLTVMSNVHGHGLCQPSPHNAAHGGAGLRAGGLQGGNLSKLWMSGEAWTGGEAVSPSKCLSLSPQKIMSTSPSSSVLPLLAQSTPPWGNGPLCSPQQSQAAGRA